MKILFVLPNETIKSNFKKFVKWLNIKFVFGFGKSLAFPILTALMPPTQDVEFIEGGHNEIDYNKDYDLVGITAVTRYSPLAYEIADEFRKRGVKVVMGGWHASALPEEAKQHADSVVIGEAEDTWPILIKDLKNGTLKPFYQPVRPVDVKNIPNPQMKIFPRNNRSSVQATRGCPYKCEFCSMACVKFRNQFRMRPINDVIEDIIDIPNKGFFFIDNSLTVNPNYSIELFKQMKDLNKRFYAYGNIDVLNKNKELLKSAQEAGCFSWFVGFDSICQESLDNVKKVSNKVKNYISSIKNIHDHGISVMGSFIFGFDYDTIDVFNKTDDFIRKSELDIPVFYVLTPFPGSLIFNRLDREGRIFTKDWSKYDLSHVVFKPKNMTVEELENNFRNFCIQQYSFSRNLNRMINGIKFGPNIFLNIAIMNNYSMLNNWF
ncbi:MAG: B12-binding domain-containing radical SAM protein [Thermoplasmatales archaeon]|nr:MAG: B12-binding domain-containing radical SAM protein [Thermoplasmatales archaeon]